MELKGGKEENTNFSVLINTQERGGGDGRKVVAFSEKVNSGEQHNLQNKVGEGKRWAYVMYRRQVILGTQGHNSQRRGVRAGEVGLTTPLGAMRGLQRHGPFRDQLIKRKSNRSTFGRVRKNKGYVLN